MSKLLRFAFLMACFFTAGTAFAAGGACPSGLPVSGNNCYFIAANGADTNSGTSAASPWAHAPGMPNCANLCAGVTPAAGEGFIFRGGDTWHFGNSSATPYTGGTWSWTWNGSSGNMIYIGVDPAWYSGASWARPVLTGDNPLTPNPGVVGDSVAGCAHQVGSNNNLVELTTDSYLYFDNFELVGLCNSDTGQPNSADDYVNLNGFNHGTVEHVYIHGWTHTASAVTNIKAFEGGSAGGSFPQVGERILYTIVDGSDSDPKGAMCNQFDGWYDVEYSVFRYVTQTVFTYLHIFHDNLVEHWYATNPNAGHGNVFEADGEYHGTNAVYDNVFRDILSDPTSQGSGNVVIWPIPDVGQTDYYFNNVMSNIYGGGNYFDIGQNANSGNQGSLVIFNNTFESADNSSILECSSTYAHPFTAANNHYITDNSSAYTSPCSGGTYATELWMTHATATADGLLSSQVYAFLPSLGNPLIAGQGTNETSFCTALSAAGLSDAAAACQSDTTYACTYDTNSHTVSCPARNSAPRPSGKWDIGAYEADSTQSSGPEPPTSLVASVQ